MNFNRFGKFGKFGRFEEFGFGRFGRFERFAFVAIAVVVAVLATVIAAQQPWNRDFDEDLKRLVPALDLRAGLTVADIGAGGGQLTVGLAKEVGPTGRVYATEMAADRMDRIRRRASEDGYTNITVLEAHAIRTNLPHGCCDAIVIRNVYHHFDEPEAINRSLFESLKPGGRVAVIDFSPNRGRPTATSPTDRDEDHSHGVDVETVVRELTAVGFERQAVEKSDDRSFMAVFRRP